MAKATPATTPPATVGNVVKLTLDEFCARLSTTVRRPELIGAYHFVERRAGRTSDTEAEYRARFDKFTMTPV